ncbi:MAG: hypothetical protein JKY31_13530 [Rhodobacteraceae bacterium]|nr:hypothetical protein [Paracoccaceae bacterium]
MLVDFLRIQGFLLDYPQMVIKPSKSKVLTIEGTFDFRIDNPGTETTVDSYSLRVEIPSHYPMALPKVFEVGNRIPRDADHHVNPDNSLCLGSPLRLLATIHRDPSLNGFTANCLVPFLYAISMGEFVLGELSHGKSGILEDYKTLLKLEYDEQVYASIHLISLRKRLANKRKCPCRCGKRLGICPFNDGIKNFRNMAPRSWFAKHVKNLDAGM